MGASYPPAALTAFACKRLRLCRPSGKLWGPDDNSPDAALDIVSIAAGIDLRKAKKEDNTMKKKMSTCEKFFREEGKEEGTENTIRNFIESKRSRHVPE